MSHPEYIEVAQDYNFNVGGKFYFLISATIFFFMNAGDIWGGSLNITMKKRKFDMIFRDNSLVEKWHNALNVKIIFHLIIMIQSLNFNLPKPTSEPQINRKTWTIYQTECECATRERFAILDDLLKTWIKIISAISS